tara:strand:- start:2153 stop:2707 length:555 start_codon:yes stop_codon:yes gene_type:complete
MRIISGKLKGKSINFLKNSTTRPLKDSVKENIFNIIMHSKSFNVEIKNSYVLDLYSGVGSFGLECISRGAKKVTFVEQDKIAYETLKKNLNQLSISDQVDLINDKVENIFNKREKFNIFFFDPPFADDGYIVNLSLLKKKKFFKLRHVVIIHRERNTEDSLDEHLKVLLIKNYGRSKIIFGVFN